MMGHINSLLVKLVDRELGETGVERLFDLAGAEPKAFRPEIVYPDAEFQALYAATKQLLEVDDRTAQEAFAAFFMSQSPKMFPAIFECTGSARNLLERVPIIHRQWPSSASAVAFRDKLSLVDSTADSLLFRYDSPNHLCRVLTRLAELCLDYFEEAGVVRELQCVETGAPHCEVLVEFGAAN